MQNKGFFGSLFDLSFSEFIATRIIKFLFVLNIISSGITSLIFLFTMFAGGFLQGVLGLIMAPIMFLVSVLIARIGLEVVIVLFRIAENTARMAGGTSETNAPSASE